MADKVFSYSRRAKEPGIRIAFVLYLGFWL